MKRLLLALVAASIVMLAGLPLALANPDNDVGVIDYDRVSTGDAQRAGSTNANPVTDAPRGHPLQPTTWVDPGPPSYGDPRCAEGIPSEYNAELDITYAGGCFAEWVCGGERIDEMLTGDIAGQELPGRYAEYLNEMIGFFASDVAAESGINDGDSVNDYLLAQGLASNHGDTDLAVFYWCGEKPLPRETGGPLSLAITPTDATRAPRFGWDTTVAAEYNLPGLRADILDVLRTLVGFYKPDIKAAPPTETGVTIVQFPTWFWLETPDSPLTAYDHNDTDTFRLEMRARFTRADFFFGDTLLESCNAEDMWIFNPDTHDMLTDRSPCHHTFTQLGQEDLTATVYFDVEERELNRDRERDPYPDAPWVPVEEIELTSTIANYQVCPIYVVNVAFDTDVDEIDAGCGGT